MSSKKFEGRLNLEGKNLDSWVAAGRVKFLVLCVIAILRGRLSMGDAWEK